MICARLGGARWLGSSPGCRPGMHKHPLPGRPAGPGRRRPPPFSGGPPRPPGRIAAGTAPAGRRGRRASESESPAELKSVCAWLWELVRARDAAPYAGDAADYMISQRMRAMLRCSTTSTAVTQAERNQAGAGPRRCCACHVSGRTTRAATRAPMRRCDVMRHRHPRRQPERVPRAKRGPAARLACLRA